MASLASLASRFDPNPTPNTNSATTKSTKILARIAYAATVMARVASAYPSVRPVRGPKRRTTAASAVAPRAVPSTLAAAGTPLHDALPVRSSAIKLFTVFDARNPIVDTATLAKIAEYARRRSAPDKAICPASDTLGIQHSQ